MTKLALTTKLLNWQEAQELVEQINEHFNSARALILELYEGEGWKALGYASWRECVSDEFEQSQAHLYRQLTAAKIEREISPIGEIGQIPESQLRPLTKLATPEQRKEAWETAVKVAPDHKPTAAVVDAIVREIQADDAPTEEIRYPATSSDTVLNYPHALYPAGDTASPVSRANPLETVPANPFLARSFDKGVSLRETQVHTGETTISFPIPITVATATLSEALKKAVATLDECGYTVKPSGDQFVVENAFGAKATLTEAEVLKTARGFEVTRQSQELKLMTSSESTEWYTPEKYLRAVQDMFGAIELDPCSSAAANRLVGAKRYFTKEQDGLAQVWHARTVWLNPPYGTTAGKSTAGLFVEKLVSELEAGNVREAIVLVNLNFGYDWFAPLRTMPMCLVDHRVSFINGETGEVEGQANANSVLVYFGGNLNRFYYLFREFGPCSQPSYDW
jgi:phage N-6-adenine-methyltransferase